MTRTPLQVENLTATTNVSLADLLVRSELGKRYVVDPNPSDDEIERSGIPKRVMTDREREYND